MRIVINASELEIQGVFQSVFIAVPLVGEAFYARDFCAGKPVLVWDRWRAKAMG